MEKVGTMYDFPFNAKSPSHVTEAYTDEIGDPQCGVKMNRC